MAFPATNDPAATKAWSCRQKKWDCGARAWPQNRDAHCNLGMSFYFFKLQAPMKYKHIAIAGNIGAGKTTLTQLLARHYGWLPQYESVENNPYIADFYEDMSRWSFHLQVYFLNGRLAQLLDIRDSDQVVVQDRTIYEDAHIFAENLYEMGLMEHRDFENYYNIFSTIKRLIAPPDLLIYLQAGIPKLVDQIQKRGREYEEGIRLDYLKRLNVHYETWIHHYTDGQLLVINIDDLDFANRPEDLAQIIDKVEAQIHGLF